MAERKLDMGSTTIKDFDKLAPAQRQARLGGRVIDVTTIPARVLLESAKFADEMETYSGEERLVKSIGIVARIAQVHDEGITTDWLLDNCSLEQLMGFIDYTLEPLKKRVTEEGAKEGNAPAAGS
jgi:hypothetical protein